MHCLTGMQSARVRAADLRASIADPLARSVDRALLVAACEGQANEADDRAAMSAKNLALFRAKLPATPPKTVEIVLTIEHDAFRESVTVDRLGAPVTRTWERLGTGVWRCRDPRWHDAERSLGVDLCTYLEYLPLPDDVLDAMAALVRASDAAEAAEHG